MIKTIKVKKKLRLDELIKYVWDNNDILKGRTHIKFTSNSNCPVIFGASGYFETDYGHDADDTFTVEVEEEIDYDTVFEEVYRVTKEGEVTSDKNKSIGECLDWKDYQVQIFAMLDGKLRLIWEAKNDVD